VQRELVVSLLAEFLHGHEGLHQAGVHAGQGCLAFFDCQLAEPFRDRAFRLGALAPMYAEIEGCLLDLRLADCVTLLLPCPAALRTRLATLGLEVGLGHRLRGHASVVGVQLRAMACEKVVFLNRVALFLASARSR
jgi:hypothetical protein